MTNIENSTLLMENSDSGNCKTLKTSNKRLCWTSIRPWKSHGHG